MRIALLLFCVSVLGCGQAEPETATVTGTVSLDGQPLTSGVVTFLPEGGRSATGYIESDGKYTLTTFNKGDGALPGKHKVSITAGGNGPSTRPDFDSDKPSTPMSPIPVKYSNPEGSGLEFEVKAGESNQANFELTTGK